VRRAFSALHILAALVLVVVLVGIGDALAAGVLERTREIGTVRAIGARRRDVSLAILLEGLGLGVVGLALAIVTGLSLGVVWVRWTFPALLGTVSLALLSPAWRVSCSPPWRYVSGLATAPRGASRSGRRPALE
jgi:putative ABC transport system permease protein